MPKLLDELRQKHEEIYAIANKYGVSNIRVFGSVARGEERKDSDIDLLATLNSGVSLFGLVKLEMILAKNLGKKIQIISDKAINKHLKERVLKEAVSI
jgi:predicted nucleotidyltransferase